MGRDQQTRELSRARARRNRAAVEALAAQRARDTSELLMGALVKARKLFSDATFVQLLYKHGVRSIPAVLLPGKRRRSKRHDACPGGEVLDCSLEFVVAWTFLFPLFKRPDIERYLEIAWPGSVLQMKDAFIAVVVDGPFPSSISGYRGRRHGARYNPKHQRPVALKQQTV